ncbi:MAG: Abi-alpha family protein [Candidatus Pacebacteria bacterium]|nr:Abi-alpha family protein [Candidatus Paceibacterota bacterium]
MPGEETIAGVIITKENISDFYKDAAQPSVRVVGKALAQCVSLFATPVGRMSEIFEKNIQKYLDKLEGLEEKEMISPDTRILVPILEKLRYTEDDVVANYYAEILAMASMKQHAKKVIITFIEILNRLSADEIRMLEHINSKDNVIKIDSATEAEIEEYNIIPRDNIFRLRNAFPVIDINRKTDVASYKVLKKNFNILDEKIQLNDPENIDLYIDNMSSLGLLEREYFKSYAFKKVYDHLEKHHAVEKLKKDLGEDEAAKIYFDRGKIEITYLGKKLLELCARKK